MIDINSFVEWVDEEPNDRMFKMEYLGYKPEVPRVWVASFKHGTSQYVQNVDEIELEEISRAEKIIKFKQLQAELEGENIAII